MKLLVGVFALVFSMTSWSDTIHSKICSKTTDVCVSVTSQNTFTTTQEGRFSLLLSSPSQEEVSLVNVDLWMQMGHHGHGSSPLKVTPVAPKEFDITKAYFVMRGQWQIRVTYQQGATQEKMIIPVMIKE